MPVVVFRDLFRLARRKAMAGPGKPESKTEEPELAQYK